VVRIDNEPDHGRDKPADLMIVKGNPGLKITDIENVEIVFKDGVAYESEKLIKE
jgi:imidazolonepropionase-like amidohydrolase